MAPHLTPAELDFIQEKERLGKEVLDIYAVLKSRRQKKGIADPHITNFRKLLKGKTYKRNRTETRGRKTKFTKRMVYKMNAVRKSLIKKAENEHQGFSPSWARRPNKTTPALLEVALSALVTGAFPSKGNGFLPPPRRGKTMGLF